MIVLSSYKKKEREKFEVFLINEITSFKNFKNKFRRIYRRKK